MNKRTLITTFVMSLLLAGPALAEKDSDGPVRQPQASTPNANQGPSTPLTLPSQWHRESDH